MKWKTPYQRLSALVLVAVLPALNGVIPILDLMVGDGKAAVEAEHHPGTHGFPHNHLICIQHHASHWVSGQQPPAQVVMATFTLPAYPWPTALVHSDQAVLPPARAPPFA